MDFAAKPDLFNKAPFGFACGYIVRDAQKRAIDFQVKDCNPNFLQIFSLPDHTQAPVAASQLFNAQEPFFADLLEALGSVEKTGRDLERDLDLFQKGRYFRVHIWSVDKEYIALLLSDISNEKLISEISSHYLAQENKGTDYQKMSDDLVLITGAKFIGFNIYDQNEKTFHTVAVSGVQQTFRAAMDLIGYDITGKRWNHDPERLNLIEDRTVTRFSNLRALTRDVLSPGLVEVLESTFRLGEVAIAKITKGNRILGDFTIFMDKDSTLRNEALIEIYTRQIGLVLDRDRAQNEIQRITRLQHMLMEVASTYINKPLDRIDELINDSLARMGSFANADRSYIFEYDWTHRVCNNTYEWCAIGITPEIDNLQNLSFDYIKPWLEVHERGEPMDIPDLFALPKNSVIRDFLEPQGIKSLLALPMMENGRCVGFVGFDSVRYHYDYTDMEKSLLQLFADMLVHVRKLSRLELSPGLRRMQRQEPKKN